MKSRMILALLACLFLPLAGIAKDKREADVIKTSGGDLKITFIGHGTLMFTWGGKVIHVDPVTREADYTKMPKADVVLITHEHADHLDLEALEAVRTKKTQVVLTEKCTGKKARGIVVKNGETITVAGIEVIAMPAYNLVHKRKDGTPFHPKGEGNGYVIFFGDKRVYVAGDTENIPEMKHLKFVDVAFLPMNLPYTMTPEMVVDAAKTFRPKILYPYHFGKTNTDDLLKLMKDVKGVEVRIRDMK